MTTLNVQKPLNYFRIVWQSALAAGLFLGLPAGLLFWLILLRDVNPSVSVEPYVTVLQSNGLNKIIALLACSLMWSFALGKISRYRAWWWVAAATVLGIIAGWFSPLSNLDGWFGDVLPMHLLYAVAMSGLVFSVTSCVGLAYGLILRNAKAALTIALATSLVSVLALLVSIVLFDQFGIRVGGTVNLAMSKVTSVSLMLSAIAGGAVLGVGFSRFVGTKQ